MALTRYGRNQFLGGGILQKADGLGRLVDNNLAPVTQTAFQVLHQGSTGRPFWGPKE